MSMGGMMAAAYLIAGAIPLAPLLGVPILVVVFGIVTLIAKVLGAQ